MIQSIISRAKNQLENAAQFAQHTDGVVDEDRRRDVYETYERRLRDMNAMDFDDLLLRSVELFADVSRRARQVPRTSSSYILVDEYQDTNAAQYELRRAARRRAPQPRASSATTTSRSTAGAAPTCATSSTSRSDFPDAAVIKLEQNYRSTGRILDAANAVVSRNTGRKGKKLWTEGPQGDKLNVRQLTDEHEEARYVAGEIQRLTEDGVSQQRRRRLLPDQRAVTRPRGHARALPHAVPGDRRHAVLRARRSQGRARLSDDARQPERCGFAAAHHQLAAPRYRQDHGRSTARVFEHSGEPVLDLVGRAEEVPGLGGAALKALARFSETMASLREKAATEKHVGDLLESVLDQSGYFDYLKSESAGDPQALTRLENLQELVGLAREYDLNSVGDDEAGLEAFLQQVALFSDQDAIVDDDGQITLMTLHNAKGLEFPVVFMIGARGGNLPAFARG